MKVVPMWIRLLLLGLLLLALIGTLKGCHDRLVGQGRDIERATWIKRDLDAAQDAGRETHRRLERQEASNRETATRAAAAADALRRERATAGQLRDELDAATAARRRGDPAAVDKCAPAEADRDLHADLFRRADDTASELAADAEAARVAGEQCERDYDALRASSRP